MGAGEIVGRKITRGRHSGRRRGEKGAAEKPGALALQGLPVGRHCVDTGKAEFRCMSNKSEEIVASNLDDFVASVIYSSTDYKVKLNQYSATSSIFRTG